MTEKAKYLMIASMDVDPEHESLFNEVYDREHIPNLSRVPGVLGIVRYKREELTMNIGGERKTMRAENEPAYSVIYELENPDVLTSPEWNDAVEAGRWPTQVRPYTRNRRHVLLKMRSHTQ
jgi:hypothetical protein